MTNVTYLIGAGASAKKIPCLNEFTEKLFSSIDFYRAEKDNIIKYAENNQQHPHSIEEIKKEYDDLLNSLETILNEAKEYSTVDTYAKFLYITQEYRKIGFLGILISMGLLFFQKDGIDKRYDTFWASILEDSIPPESIKIISWNYDSQFEQSYLKFSKLKRISEAQAFLKVFPSNSFSLVSDFRNNSFSLVKLNGGIVTYNPGSGRFETLVDNCIEFYGSIVNILLKYINWIPEWNSKRVIHMGYAWDSIKVNPENTSVNIAKHIVNQTDVLVIVGYSFPFFNRSVDREILNSIPNLKTIYIQDLYPENIVSRLDSILSKDILSKIRIEPLKDTEQFFIPFDL